MRNGNESEIKKLEGEKLKKVFKFAANILEKKKSIIDSLNVFPVPDGDTGTNMHLTMQKALEEIEQQEGNHAGDICQSLSKGALMGARGNSGVILSQLLRGFAQANRNNKVIKAESFVEGLEEASRVAYKGVLKPVEGTILTVSRRAAEGAREAYEDTNNIVEILREAYSVAIKALNKTPEQLPVLKEADVVDAGGQGYVFILEGMLNALEGEKLKPVGDTAEKLEEYKEKREAKEIEYKYCTQLLINLGQNNGQGEIEKIRSELSNYGNSLMVVGSDNIIKVHIHTNHPGVILEYSLKLGPLENISIDNMEFQQESHQDFMKAESNEQITASGMSLDINNKSNNLENTEENKDDEIKKRGLIAIAAGEGVKDIFKQLGVDRVIHGGQSMNPSTNDILSALKDVNAKELIVFPNNKNIISAARQAAELCEDKKIEVISTESFTEAIASLMLYNEENNLKELTDAMEDEIEKVKTIEITRAVKDSNVKDLSIEEGEVIGLVNGDIIKKGKDYENVVLEIIDEIFDDENLITIYYGEEVNKKDAENLRDKILNGLDNSNRELEVYPGEQPLYPYVISLE